jgi:large subunit ribosomal protein L24
LKKQGITKPSKNRKRRYTAPNHIKRKYLSAPLSTSLRAEHGTRAIPVVEGDTVTILKGDRKFSEGKVLKVDTKNSRIYLEGITRTRMDGSTVQIPLSVNNVVITRLNIDDDWRRRIIDRRGFTSQEG